jgi:hypothetical protein
MIVVSTRRMLTNEERLELDIINNNVISNYWCCQALGANVKTTLICNGNHV